MSYIQDNLLPNEKVHFRAKINPAIFLRSLLTFAFGIVFLVYAIKPAQQISDWDAVMGALQFLAAMCFFAVAIIVGIRTVIILLTTEFGVTNKRIIAKRGFIRRHTMEMFLKQVETVEVKQNILGRLLRFGTVTVIGTGGTRESFGAITDPVKTRKIIQQIIEHYVHNQTATA